MESAASSELTAWKGEVRGRGHAVMSEEGRNMSQGPRQFQKTEKRGATEVDGRRVRGSATEQHLSALGSWHQAS